MKYEDFTILFTADSGCYQARVISSPAGEVTGEFIPPLSPAMAAELIVAYQQFLPHPMRDITPDGAFGTEATPRAASSLESFGTDLFRALFHGPVGQLFDHCLGHIAQRGDCGLRLKLRLNPSELQLAPIYALPWEYLYRQETRTFLALSNTTSIVRYLDVPRPAISVPLPSILRILAVFPNPTNTAPLDLDREREIVERTFEGLGSSLELTILQPATIQALRETLLEVPYHIVHFSGHGALGPFGGAGLVYESESGAGQFVDAASLAEVLGNSTSVRLAVINACNGATISEGSILTSVASALVVGGIPAVIANQYPISDGAAVVFSQSFYHALAVGRSLDEAVADARIAIRQLTPGSSEWGVPCLFSRLPANALFSVNRKGAGDEFLRSAALEALRSVDSEPRASTVEDEVEASKLREMGREETERAPHTLTYREAFEPVRDLTEFVLRELEAGHQQARHEVDRWSRGSLYAAALGLSLVGATMVLLLAGKIGAGILSAVSSFVTTSVAGLFFAQARGANRRMDARLHELTLARDVHVASEIASSISSEEEKDRLKVAIVSRVLQNTGRDGVSKSARRT